MTALQYNNAGTYANNRWWLDADVTVEVRYQAGGIAAVRCAVDARMRCCMRAPASLCSFCWRPARILCHTRAQTWCQLASANNFNNIAFAYGPFGVNGGRFNIIGETRPRHARGRETCQWFPRAPLECAPAHGPRMGDHAQLQILCHCAVHARSWLTPQRVLAHHMPPQRTRAPGAAEPPSVRESAVTSTGCGAAASRMLCACRRL